ncbi:A/G-specific adenine glycosylase [Candidatus Berkelbacteria bacterium]|nr:A/G-specific adenine glycosylase [Candidatus Berkelbacteria bacterium]
MLRLTTQRIAEIQRTALSWYAQNRRDLPWRETADPYKILVSEIMLQQTQVSRVVSKYHDFLTQFPTVNDLAAASTADVIRAWKGLGYNRRALNLQRAARVVVEHGGTWLSTVEWLRSLPGVGRYTAGAIMNFAFGIDTPAVDTNVRQFIDHFIPSRRSRSENEYYGLAGQLIPNGTARIWLHAVMDYTSLVLRPATPRKRSATPAEPFVGSNRYLRGRTLDQLRNAPQTLAELFTHVAAPLGVDRTRYEQLLAALEREGFIHQHGRTLELAG